jgi:hypothetical protein
MSVKQIVVDKLNTASALIENKSSEEIESMGDQIDELMKFVEVNVPNTMQDFIESMHGCSDNNPTEEQEIINKFRGYDPEDRNIIVAMMKFIVNMGKVENESDVPKRERWFALVSSNNN